MMTEDQGWARARAMEQDLAAETAAHDRRRRQLVTSDEAVPVTHQHRQPCSDCPWARVALRGWLGDATADTWLRDAHGEARIECHTLLGAQCAGAAIYRANVCKRPRDPETLLLPADKATVFATPAEFTAHHAEPGPTWTVRLWVRSRDRQIRDGWWKTIYQGRDEGEARHYFAAAARRPSRKPRVEILRGVTVLDHAGTR